MPLRCKVNSTDIAPAGDDPSVSKLGLLVPSVIGSVGPVSYEQIGPLVTDLVS
jgi:hypothetical protein